MNNFLGVKFKALKLAQTSSTPIYFEAAIVMAFSFSSKMRSVDGLHWGAEISLVSDFSVAANVGTVIPLSAVITGDSTLLEGACVLIPSLYIGSANLISKLSVQAQMSADYYNTIQSVITIADFLYADAVVCAADNLKSDITITSALENIINTADALHPYAEISLVSDFSVAANVGTVIPLSAVITGDFAIAECSSKLSLSLYINPTVQESRLAVNGKIQVGNYKLMKSEIAMISKTEVKSILCDSNNLQTAVSISNSIMLEIASAIPLDCAVLSENNLNISASVSFCDSLTFIASSYSNLTGTAEAVIESACNIEAPPLKSALTVAANVGLLKHLQLSDLAGKTLAELGQTNLKDMCIAQI